MKNPSNMLLLVGTAATVLGILIWSKAQSPNPSPAQAPQTIETTPPGNSSETLLPWNPDQPSPGPAPTTGQAAEPQAEPSGPVDEALLQEVAGLYMSPGTIALPSAKVVQEFEKRGFRLAPTETSNPQTGLRKSFNQAKGPGGFFNVNVSYSYGTSGQEFLEGIRMSISSEGDAFEQAVKETEAKLGKEWKPAQKDEFHATWENSQGYVMWIRKYTEKDPPPEGTNPNVVRMGLEPSQG